jgi:zinc transport system substrate-binding protein
MSLFSPGRWSAVLALLLAAAPASAEVRLLTSIKPLQLIAAAVQDGAGQPDVLLPAGASAHDYALRPSDVQRLRKAELFYWIGPDMEGFLARPLAARDAESIAVQQLSGLKLRHFGDEKHQHEHEHDEHHEHDDHPQHGGGDHAHRRGSLDAHLWLLPVNARAIAARMAEDLARLDPPEAARYQANLAAFNQRLDQLDGRLQARLQPLRGKPFFVAHEAYDYFEAAFGLQHRGVFSLGADMQPGVRHVAQMREQLRAAGPACVFSEPPLRPRLAETLSAGLPVTLAELDPLGSNVKVGARGYETLLENLAGGLANCLEKL